MNLSWYRYFFGIGTPKVVFRDLEIWFQGLRRFWNQWVVGNVRTGIFWIHRYVSYKVYHIKLMDDTWEAQAGKLKFIQRPDCWRYLTSPWVPGQVRLEWRWVMMRHASRITVSRHRNDTTLSHFFHHSASPILSSYTPLYPNQHHGPPSPFKNTPRTTRRSQSIQNTSKHLSFPSFKTSISQSLFFLLFFRSGQKTWIKSNSSTLIPK